MEVPIFFSSSNLNNTYPTAVAFNEDMKFIAIAIEKDFTIEIYKIETAVKNVNFFCCFQGFPGYLLKINRVYKLS